jgi:solute carrier family 38 (sodium-coupled neutral amino acid transporter), member 11
MANSIIGAGIIGQAYAFRRAGLTMGILLLVALTVTVDWTVRLIVINSKLAGADSFQATVQHCFGRPGLVAISLAQWAFAFGGMVAFCVIVGDTIPHVMGALIPGLGEMSFLWLLTDRRFVIVLFVLGVSWPLSLYRDIAKVGIFWARHFFSFPQVCCRCWLRVRLIAILNSCRKHLHWRWSACV